MTIFAIQHDPDGRGWTHDRLGLGTLDTRGEAFETVRALLEKDGQDPGSYRIVEHDGRSAGWVVATWRRGVPSGRY